MAKQFEQSTLGVRAGQRRTGFQEHSEALFLTSSFVFDSAQQAAGRFTGGEEGFVYSRFTNPTVSMFQERLAALEGAEACVATSSGMSAILATAMSLLKSGDHIVCSNAVFGATVQLYATILSRFGIETTFVSPTRVEDWQRAVRPKTKLLFLETPSNPLGEISDIAALAAVAKKAGAMLAVDNALCTPALQRPLEFGADLVIHSATKYLDGQGRVLGGAVLGAKGPAMDAVFGFLRTAGPSLSPFNAWVILKGMETLELRMFAQSERALELARWLEGHPKVARVHYPGLTSHPDHALARRQMRGFGAMLAFDLKGGLAAARRFCDRVRVFLLAASLGGVESLVVLPMYTSHYRMSSAELAGAGVSPGTVRVSIGLEDPKDLIDDLKQALG